jgi:hypothetical protein
MPSKQAKQSANDMPVGGPLQRYDEALCAFDPEFRAFARQHHLTIARNERESVGYSLRWGSGPRGLIQLFLSNIERGEWKLWLCCSQDRGDERYWRTQYLLDGQPLDDFARRLPTLLADGLRLVNDWRAHPDQLEFATKLGSPLV